MQLGKANKHVKPGHTIVVCRNMLNIENDIYKLIRIK